MRIVALTCSNTELVCALGAGDELVGVDDHSDHPAEVVGRLPRVGPDLGVDPARVAGLRPDLVLASLTVPGHERVVESLERAGLPVVVLAPISVADVLGDTRRLGALLGREAEADALARELGEALAPRPGAAGGPTILVEWWPRPVIVPGRDSWVRDLLAAAGARGVLDAEPVKSRPLREGEIAALDPDAIVIAWCGVPLRRYRPEVVARRPGWGELRAVRGGQIHPVAEAFLGRPGPRLAEGARALRAIVDRVAPRLS